MSEHAQQSLNRNYVGRNRGYARRAAAVTSSLARRFVLLGLLSVALAIAGCAARGDAESGSKHARSSNPLAGRSFYVDPASAAALQVKHWREEGRNADASTIAELAVQPTADWITNAVDVGRVQQLTTAAARLHKSTLLVAYYIPGRDCGQYSAGGAASADAYRQWIDQFATAIGRRAATVIVEPDAIAQSVSGCVPSDQLAMRYQLLRYAVRQLSALKNTVVYLDAGNAGWIKPLDKLVSALRQSGIASADGFALNVSNFYGTDTTIRYGSGLSRALGGRHFVIDTSRNGNGPYHGSSDGAPNWCNPPGRAIGQLPSTHTGNPLVDAFLWIKEPGASDGACRPGAPAAGQWWPDYAVGLVRDKH
jgi:endoglucanase